MLLRAVVVLVVIDAGWALARHPHCRIEGNDDYDFKSLKLGEEDKPYYAVSPSGHYRYYFNFCGHAHGCYQQPSCQVRLVTDSAGRAKEDVATVTTTGELYRMKWETLDEDDLKMVNNEMSKEEIDKSYDAGVKVTYSIGPKHRRTVVRLPCDPDADPNERKSDIKVVEQPILTYNIVFPSAAACPVSFTKKQIRLPSVASVAHKKTHFFGLMLFVGLIVYCCAGCYYKRERLGAQGMEAIPHIDTITACVDGVKNMFAGEGGLLNRARGVSDDGL
jgi:hypothetical protein